MMGIASLFRNHFTVAICAAQILLALFILNHTYLNIDIAWHLYVASNMLEGKKLYVDFHEVNLPLMFYYSMIPVFLSNLLGISDTALIKGTDFSIVLLSFYLCFRIAKDSSLNTGKLSFAVFITFLCFASFLLPFYEDAQFGQKEHLFFMLTLPYVLSVLQPNFTQTASLKFRILISILAALGFCIKPFFVLIFAAVECFQMWQRRNFFYWLRLEPILIGAIGLSFLCSIILFTPEYFTDIIPFAKIVYMYFRNSNVTIALSFPLYLSIYIILIACLYYWARKNEISYYFLLLLTCSILVVALQFKGWSYHFYPARAYSFILIAILSTSVWGPICNYFKATKKWTLFPGITLPVGLAISVFLITNLNSQIHNAYSNRLHETTFATSKTVKMVKNDPSIKSLMALSHSFGDSFPLINYTNTTFPSRFQSLWPEFSFANYRLHHLDKPSDWVEERIGSIEKTFIHNLVEDIRANKPDLILVPTYNARTIQWDLLMPNPIAYLSQDPEFIPVWKHYKKVDTIYAEKKTFAVYRYRGPR